MNLRERHPLSGLFDRDSFLLHKVDKTIVDFLSNVLPTTRSEFASCFVAFPRHDAFYAIETDEPQRLVTFYRWAAWTPKYPIISQISSIFRKVNSADCFAISSCDYVFDGQRCGLAAEFMAKIKEKLSSMPLKQIKNVQLQGATNGQLVDIERGGDNLWHIPNPQETLKNFVSTVKSKMHKKTKIAWTILRPIEIDGTLGGVIALDGTRPDQKGSKMEHEHARRPLAAALAMFEATLDALYKAYYTQLEYGSPEYNPNKPDHFDWDCAGLVYSSSFLRELRESVLLSTDGADSKYRTAPYFYPGYVLAYFDGNGMKSFNDTGSHLLGNEIIRALGRWLHCAFWYPITLQQECRPSDYREPLAWVTRIAGDEFAVLLAFPQTATNAYNNRPDLSGKMRESVHLYLTQNDSQCRHSLSKRLEAILPNSVWGDKKESHLDKVSKVSMKGGWVDNLMPEPDGFSKVLLCAEDAMIQADAAFDICWESGIKHGQIGAICYDKRARCTEAAVTLDRKDPKRTRSGATLESEALIQLPSDVSTLLTRSELGDESVSLPEGSV